MKKMFVGMMLVLMLAAMIIPCGSLAESADVVYLEEDILIEDVLEEIIIKEDKIEEVILTEEEFTEFEFDDDSNYIITIGGDHLIRIQVIHRPGFIQKISDGFSWFGDKVKDGFDTVVDWFTPAKG